MFGASLLLACNRIFVVGYFGVRAREADRRAELALCGIFLEILETVAVRKEVSCENIKSKDFQTPRCNTPLIDTLPSTHLARTRRTVRYFTHRTHAPVNRNVSTQRTPQGGVTSGVTFM